MELHVTEEHKMQAQAMLKDVDGKMLHPVDVALLVARLIADAESMRNELFDIHPSRGLTGSI